MAHPAFTAFSIAWLLGIVLIVSGINILVNYFGKKEGTGWDVFFGILSLIGGLLMLFNYYSAIFANTVLVYIIAVIILMTGITRIAASLRLKKLSMSWGWPMVSGILSVLTALIAMINPIAGMLLIDYMLAFLFMIQGINMIFLGISMKSTK